jgi:PKD repeat protein
VHVEGSTAYVAAKYAGLQMIDVSDPTAPTLLGSFATDGYATDVQVVGSTAYVAVGDLHIIDVSDPAAPQQLMRSALPFDARAIQVVDGLVYVAGEDRLVVLRPVSLTLQGPLQGKVATTYTFTAESMGLAEDGDVTYTWQASEHDPVVHPNGGSSDEMTFSWNTPGNKTVTLSAEHGTERQVRSHTITIYRPPEQVHIQGPATAELSATIALSAIVTPTDALISSYIWEPAPLRGQGTPAASYQWGTPGTQVITLTAANGGGVVSSTHRLRVGEPPTAVQIHAPAQVVLGQHAVFTATATPAAAMVSRYRWEPAPLQGQGTDQATYHWNTPGTHVITLTAANFPPISTTHTITNMLAPLQAVHLDGSPVGVVNTPHHLHAQVTPPFATRPLTYTWQSDDHPPLVRQTDNVTASHILTWAMPGTQTVTLTVANAGNTITRTMQVYVTSSAAQSPPETVQPEGPATGEVEQSITITATVHPITATLPVSDTFYGPYALNAGGNGRAGGAAKVQRAQSSAQENVESDGFLQQQEVVTSSITSVPLVYIWQASGYPPVVRTAGISDTFAVTWAADGVKQVEVMVVNSGGRITQTHAILLGMRLQAVEIDGPATGEANRAYAFQATVVPTSATLLDYRWSPPPQAGQGTPKATYTWEDGGTKEVSLTASNHLGSITASREVEVTAWNNVYLPLVTQ